MSISTVIFVILLVSWILGWSVFHVGPLINLLLLAAVVSLCFALDQLN